MEKYLALDSLQGVEEQQSLEHEIHSIYDLDVKDSAILVEDKVVEHHEEDLHFPCSNKLKRIHIKLPSITMQSNFMTTITILKILPKYQFLHRIFLFPNNGPFQKYFLLKQL